MSSNLEKIYQNFLSIKMTRFDLLLSRLWCESCTPPSVCLLDCLRRRLERLVLSARSLQAPVRPPATSPGLETTVSPTSRATTTPCWGCPPALAPSCSRPRSGALWGTPWAGGNVTSPSRPLLPSSTTPLLLSSSSSSRPSSSSSSPV